MLYLLKKRDELLGALRGYFDIVQHYLAQSIQCTDKMWAVGLGRAVKVKDIAAISTHPVDDHVPGLAMGDCQIHYELFRQIPDFTSGDSYSALFEFILNGDFIATRQEDSFAYVNQDIETVNTAMRNEFGKLF